MWRHHRSPCGRICVTWSLFNSNSFLISALGTLLNAIPVMTLYFATHVFLIVETMCESERIRQLSDAIRQFPDFPSPGVIFRFVC